MRPFLSPARIVLLSLIDMYCTSAVRPEDDDFVLQLIASYMADAYARPSNARQRLEARWRRAYVHVDLLAHLDSLRVPLQSCFAQSYFSAGATTTALAATMAAVLATPGLPMCATLWDTLVARLWLRLSCLDDLVVFFEGLHQCMAPTYTELRARREHGIEDPSELLVLLDRRTPMGQFVYQSCIEFSRLAFDDRCDLWEDFVRYRRPSRTDFGILWPHDFPTEQLRTDAVLDVYQQQWGMRAEALESAVYDRALKDNSVAASSDETEKLVSLLIDRERCGFRPSQVLRDATDEAIAGTTLIPSQATYYRLADAWRMGDMNTAYDQLHRFFDLVARQGVGAVFGYNMGPMNKAVMQRDFGAHPDDLLSMLDSVQAGRDSRDYNTLRFSLLWLYLYARAQPQHIRPHQLQGLAGRPTDGAQVLPYVRQDAQRAHAPTHRALAFVLEARVSLGDGRTPRHARICLHRGSRLAVAHNDNTLYGMLASTTTLFWESLGQAPLAAIHARAFMRTRLDDVPFDDAVRVASRLALLIAHTGDFSGARAVLGSLGAEGLTSLRPRSMVRHVRTIIAAMQALRTGRCTEADELLRKRLPAGGYPLSMTAPVNINTQGPSELDPELSAHVALLQVEAACGEDGYGNGNGSGTEDGSLTAARRALEAFEAAYDSDVGDLHVVVRIALARCDLYARAGLGVRALSLLVRTVQACLRRRYHALLWVSVGALARLLVGEAEFQAARELLVVVLPRVLQTGDAALAAQLYRLLGDAHMGLAGESRMMDAGKRMAKMQRHLEAAWSCLAQAERQFGRAGAGSVVSKEMAMKRRTIVGVRQRMGS